MKISYFAITLIILAGTLEKAHAFELVSACTSRESLRTGKDEKVTRWMTYYQSFAKKNVTPIMGFSDALYLRKIGMLLKDEAIERDFSEFWVGRVFFQLGIDPLAHQIFRSVYENSPHLVMKTAAFRCMGEIQKRSPDWKVPKDISDLLSAKLTDAHYVDLADAFFLWGIGDPQAAGSIAKKLPELQRTYLLAFAASLKKKYLEASQQLAIFTKYFETIKAEISEKHFMHKYLDSAYLLAGRAYYSLGRYTDSVKAFQSVNKTSNLQIDALSDLSWAYLQADKADDAIGIAIQLRSGALRNAFAPEPLMVAAIALNEVCNYPDSTYFINGFFKDYEPVFKWLKSKSSTLDHYAEVLKALKKQSTVPNKITTEWMRNKEFLTRQLQINDLIGHSKKFQSAQAQAFAEQAKITDSYILDSQKFILDLKKASLALKPGQELDPKFGLAHLKLKRDLRRLTQYYRSSKMWKKLTEGYSRKIPSFKTALIQQIQTGLSEQSSLMLRKLADIKENTYMIEVEIYNGASQDLVFKNAHPNFKADEIDLDKEKAAASEVYSWGRFNKGDLEGEEVWEDELGALKADTSDQCQKKEKYLKLKVRAIEE